MKDVLYRAREGGQSLDLSEHMNPTANLLMQITDSVGVDEFEIHRRTACGAWIHDGEKPRFVNLNCKRQWASATKVEALRQLTHRRRHQIGILQSQLDRAKGSLAQAEELIKREEELCKPLW